MEHNRKMAIIVMVSVLILVALLFVFNPRAETSTISYRLGLLIGSVPGILTCLYLYIVWDPKNLSLRNPNARKANSHWMPLVVIASIIIARISTEILSPEINIVLTNCIFVAVVIV